MRATTLRSVAMMNGQAAVRRAAFSSVGKPITKEEVQQALEGWGNALCAISNTYAEKGDYVGLASKVLDAAYAYNLPCGVLFKPTLADQVTFRLTKESALSYFVGGSPPLIHEDTGFAIRPWLKAAFEIAGIIPGSEMAIVMGNKLLVTKDYKLVKANFTMGFTRDPQSGNLKICLHHSSLPYVTPEK